MHTTVARSAVYQLLSKLISSGVGFFLTIIIAAFYGATFYGDFTKITSAIALFYLLIDFGLNAVFLQADQHEEKLATLLWGRIIFAFVIVAGIILLAPFIPYNIEKGQGISPQLRLPLVIFSFTIVFQSIIFSSLALFQKQQKYQNLLWLTAVGSFLTLFLSIFFAMLHMSLSFVIGAYTAGAGASAAMALLFIRKSISHLTPDKVFLKNLFQKSWPLGLMLVCNLVYFRIDIILLSFLRSSAEVGFYGYAYKFFDFLLTIPLYISNAFYPFLLAHHRESRLHEKKGNYILIYFMLSLGITLVVWIAAPLIAVIRHEFIPSVFALRILLLSLPLFFLTSILQWMHIAQGHQKILLFVYAGSAVLNICLNIMFIPLYGMYASAAITSLTEGVVLLALFMIPLAKNNQKILD